MTTELNPTAAESEHMRAVMQRVLEAVRADVRIKLPPFDGASAVTAEFALQNVPDNDYSGVVGPYRYQFEGEDDLLHLYVLRAGGGAVSTEEGRRVVGLLLPDLPPALIWLKPGEHSQHFYFGQDELIRDS